MKHWMYLSLSAMRISRNRLPNLLRQFLILVAVSAWLTPDFAHAYIGPGAGFAFLGSSFVFLLSILMGILTILIWPAKFLWRYIRGKGIPKGAKTRRVVILGLDGLDPKLLDTYISQGKLPNFQKLASEGSYTRLGTTLPALSPVAWSTFQTGVNPGAHNIFDFLTRDKRFCLPALAATESDYAGKFLSLGNFKLQLRAPRIRIWRKSKPFWKVLGEQGIYSSVLRVPISYPPEKFDGAILSAMCTPDLRGTQGSFTVFTSRPQSVPDQSVGGRVVNVTPQGNSFEAQLEGPPDPNDQNRYLSASFKVSWSEDSEEAEIGFGDAKVPLRMGHFSDWIHVRFKFGLSKEIAGICRVCLRQVKPHVFLYFSPINVDPEQPALPISWPAYFANWIAKRIGPYGTLGLMEDTWGRNEHALDDRLFLEQTWLTHKEREEMFFEALERTREGVCACVFDASDRIQHMFWRYIDDSHPSPREEHDEFKGTIEQMYQRMDDLLGRVRQKLKPSDVLIVLSDHGFSSFRRGINLNTWLLENGYLAIKGEKPSGADYFADVDWSRTKAFGCGLAGIYLNLQGRENYGIVQQDDIDRLKQEISNKLEALKDPQDGAKTIRKVYDTKVAYHGLYVDEAPDLVIGYAPGYRVSWESVTGTIEPQVFSNNLKAWSGDHHVDPSEVPGILLCNRKFRQEKAHISDLAPTVLDLFQVKIPAYMEGKALL